MVCEWSENMALNNCKRNFFIIENESKCRESGLSLNTKFFMTTLNLTCLTGIKNKSFKEVNFQICSLTEKSGEKVFFLTAHKTHSDRFKVHETFY